MIVLFHEQLFSEVCSYCVCWFSAIKTILGNGNNESPGPSLYISRERMSPRHHKISVSHFFLLLYNNTGKGFILKLTGKSGRRP